MSAAPRVSEDDLVVGKVADVLAVAIPHHLPVE
jgi:hypothetical protein